MEDARFQTTRWSMVGGTGSLDADVRRQALEALCSAYWVPLYAYLRSRGRSPDESADLVQGLFAKLLDRGSLGRVEPGAARFRSWLLTALIHHERDVYRQATADRRGGGRPTFAIDFTDAEDRAAIAGPNRDGHGTEDPEAAFERAWAREVLRQALGLLEQQETARGRGATFAALSPALSGEQDRSWREEQARELGLSSVALRVTLHRLRERYREAIVETVRDTIGEDVDAKSEFDLLAAALAGGRQAGKSSRGRAGNA